MNYKEMLEKVCIAIVFAGVSFLPAAFFFGPSAAIFFLQCALGLILAASLVIAVVSVFKAGVKKLLLHGAARSC